MTHRRGPAVAGLVALAFVATVVTSPAAGARPPVRRANAVNAAHWCDDSTRALPNVRLTTHFAIWYGTIGGGLTISQYANVLEHVWAKEIGSFRWAAPPSYRRNPAPGGRYPVRVDAIADYGFVAPNGAHAGFVGNNPATGWNEGDAQASCMVLNRNFTTLVPVALDGLKVTAAHEFFHAITRGLGVTSEIDRSYREGGAAWMEDEVYDGINDNYQYLWPLWQESMGAYPDIPDDKAYGYWLVWRGLTEQYGTGVAGGAEDILQRIVEGVSKGKKQLPATKAAFAAEHTYLYYAYHQLAVAARFMKPCGGGYVPPLCFEEAPAYLVDHPANFPVNGTVTPATGYVGSIRDDFSLNWVRLPDTPDQYPINFKNLSSNSPMFWSIACDIGSGLRLDMWGPIQPGKTGSLGVDRDGCVGPTYLTVTNHRVSAPNPTNSPMASFKVWVPYADMEGSVSWTVTGSSSGTDGDITWNESWSESGTFNVKVKRDPVNFADYLVVNNGSGYTIQYSQTRTEDDASPVCSTTYTRTGSGAGTFPATFLGTTFPNLDPPDPIDDFGSPDLLGLLAGMPLDYTDTWGGTCGSGTGDGSGSGPFFHGIDELPACVPAALAGQDFYTAGWAFVGSWVEADQHFDFGCSKTLPVTDGNQTITISGTVSYPALP